MNIVDKFVFDSITKTLKYFTKSGASGGIGLGRTDGVASSAGMIGETIEVPITTSRSTVTLNVFVDSTETITLAPGKWRLELLAQFRVTSGATGAGAALGGVYLTDAANTVLENYLERITLVNSDNYAFKVNNVAYVNIAATTTYKARIKSAHTAASNSSSLELLGNGGGEFFAGETRSYFKAVRIA